MYARLYHHPRQLEVAALARTVVAGLFAAYAVDTAALPDHWRDSLPSDAPGRARHIADFIAGMTDRYAIGCYRKLVGPIELPEGF
jgi:dGTPase